MARSQETPWDACGRQKLEKAGRIFPWSLGKQRGPADTLISDFWPLELGEAEQVSVAVSPPVCDNLLWWPLEIDGTGGSRFLSDLSLTVWRSGNCHCSTSGSLLPVYRNSVGFHELTSCPPTSLKSHNSCHNFFCRFHQIFYMDGHVWK